MSPSELATTSPLNPKPLNPHADSWIPEPKTSSTTPSHEHKKSLNKNIMFPHEIYTQPSPPSSAIFEPFQRSHFHQTPPLQTPLYIFKTSFEQSFDIGNFYGGCCYYNLGFQPKPATTLLVPPPSIFGTVVFKLGSYTAEEVENEILKKGMDQMIIEEKRDSENVSCGEEVWKSTKRFVPPRFRRSRSFECRRRKTLRQVWKPRKAKSDDGVSVGGVVVSSSSPPPTSPPTPKQDSPFTTVMIRNIPNQYRRDNFMQFLDVYCKKYNLEYDFLYLPMDFWRKDNLGYAFVNFTTAAGASKIKSLLEGFKWFGNQLQDGTIFSKKVCEMTWAKIQGKAALVKHFQNSNFTCDNSEYLPVVLSPPRHGSGAMIVPKTLGNLMGLPKFPRPVKK